MPGESRALALLLGCGIVVACSSFDSGAIPADAGGGGSDASAAQQDGDAAGACASDAVLAFDFEGSLATGAPVKDDSPAGNSGVAAGISGTDGIRGQAVQFGAGSVEVVSSAALEFSGKEATIAFWLRANQVIGADHVLFGKAYLPETGTQPYYAWGVELDSDTQNLALFIGEASGSSATYRLPGPFTARWSHAAFVLHEGQVTGYVDGTRISSQPVPAITKRSGGLRFGLDPYGLQPYSGALDEIRIYARALDDGEIRCLAKR